MEMRKVYELGYFSVFEVEPLWDPRFGISKLEKACTLHCWAAHKLNSEAEQADRRHLLKSEHEYFEDTIDFLALSKDMSSSQALNWTMQTR